MTFSDQLKLCIISSKSSVFNATAQKTVQNYFCQNICVNTALHWQKLGETKNKCTSHNFSLFLIFMSKNIEVK